MSFRQNNAKNRKWNAFYQANKDLIQAIGLPGPTVDTWDRFADLLMHGHIDHHADPSRFALDELNPDQRKLFILLVDNYFEAGFHDPGMHPALVGGREKFLELVRKYPAAFSEYYQKEAEEMKPTPSGEG